MSDSATFRHLAREAAKSARAELDAESEERVRYAALQLRLAIELLTYQRALQFEGELSVDKLSTWQPRKLVNLLLEIDPNADSDSIIMIGIQNEPGVPSSDMRPLGVQRQLKLSDIKDHYHALGKLLHAQTIDEYRSGGPIDWLTWRGKCNEILILVETALSGSIFGARFRNVSEIDCGRCGKHLARSFRFDRPVFTDCDCGAQYEIKIDAEMRPVWTPMIESVRCPHECGSEIRMWRRQLEAGNRFKCDNCNQTSMIALCISQVN